MTQAKEAATVTKRKAETPTTRDKGESPTPRNKKGRAIRLKTMNDVRVEMAHVYTDARRRVIAPEEASKLTYILGQVGRVIEGSDLEERVNALAKHMGLPI